MKLSRTALKRLAFIALAILGCLLPALPAAAATPPESRAAALASLRQGDASERRRGAAALGRLGTMADAPALLAALADADARVRTTAESAVWAVWSRSGDRRVDAMFTRGVAQMNAGRLEEAVATFSRVIDASPEFAEGWNKRATAYFLAGKFAESKKDCDEVLRRNPQHFGALSGYGQIYLALDEPEKALEYFRRAIEVNPNLDGVQEMIERLEALTRQRLRRSI